MRVAHRVTTLGPCSVEAASRPSRLVVEASIEAASRFCVEASRPEGSGRLRLRTGEANYPTVRQLYKQPVSVRAQTEVARSYAILLRMCALRY